MMWPILIGLVAILFILGFAFWYACVNPTSQVLGPTLVARPDLGLRVTLTFDDGPHEASTEKILDILRDKQVPATFFVCGKNVERLPDTVRRALAEGHTIGNHTYSHIFLYFRRRSTIAAEIDRTQEALERLTGERPKIFRPPYGGRWFGLISVLAERGMRMVMWSDAGYDWNNDAEGIVRDTLKGLRPGAIILLHDGLERRPPGEINQANTVRALPLIIDEARKAGYTFVRIEEFLKPAEAGVPFCHS
jgi:peptidoglycan/xylan/chitin deacetylase (PgdA/CDA1 family)